MKAIGLAFLKAILQIIGSVIAALILAAWAWSAEPPSPGAQPILGSRACQPGEGWGFGSAIPRDHADSFQQFLRKRLSPVRSFAEAMDLRRRARTPEEKYFAEYWISRSLYGASLVHLAREGFSVLASRPVTDSTAAIQLAALECLSQINLRFPSVGIEPKVAGRLPEYAPFASALRKSQILWDVVALRVLDAQTAGRMSAAELRGNLEILRPSGAHLALIKGVLASRKSDFSGAIRNLRAFLSAPDRTPVLRRYTDTAHILAARSLYTLGRYDGAAAHYQQVSKSSNELANSLQELAWADLMDGRYAEAIGTAMNLRSGGLRHTFAPEAPMVMAMAMNELCQYPDSLKATNLFRRDYEKPYRWLENWLKNGRSENLYRLAVDYLKRAGKTPVRIASEWVRSPLFLADQEEINLLFDEKGASSQLSHLGSVEQNRLADRILHELADLKPRFYKARAEQKPGEPLPSRIRDELANLKLDLIHFRRLQRAAPMWKAVLASYRRQAGPLERRLAAEINGDLEIRTRRMLSQLDEIAENIQLIEVEIYNGASEDIVWQNAHPDFKKLAAQLQDPDEKESGAKVWDWGHTAASTDSDGSGEIWEDELGSFKAELNDNCSSKDRYLALKLGHRGGTL